MFTKTALVVDDSFTAQAVLKKLLLQFDYHVETRNSGAEALNYLAGAKADIIFLDHIMPGMDGFQVLRTLKGDPKLRDIPVIMYTSQAAKKYTAEALALGAAGVLSKQVNTDVLSQMLDRAEQQRSNQMLEMDYEIGDEDLDGLVDTAESAASGVNSAQLRHLIQQELNPMVEYQREQIQSLHDRLGNLTQHQTQLDAQTKHAAWQRLAGVLMWFLPALLCVVLYYENREQAKQISQLNNTLGKQQQELAIATTQIDDNLQWAQERSKEEYEDLLYMLESLVASIEQKEHIQLSSVQRTSGSLEENKSATDTGDTDEGLETETERGAAAPAGNGDTDNNDIDKDSN